MFWGFCVFLSATRLISHNETKVTRQRDRRSRREKKTNRNRTEDMRTQKCVCIKLEIISPESEYFYLKWHFICLKIQKLIVYRECYGCMWTRQMRFFNHTCFLCAIRWVVCCFSYIPILHGFPNMIPFTHALLPLGNDVWICIHDCWPFRVCVCFRFSLVWTAN